MVISTTTSISFQQSYTATKQTLYQQQDDIAKTLYSDIEFLDNLPQAGRQKDENQRLSRL
jgi:hypothetical protein